MHRDVSRHLRAAGLLTFPSVDNPYVELTRELNRGRLRAILSSGQAVVLYRLAIMSKDGDWILREDAETLHHTLDGPSFRALSWARSAPDARSWSAASTRSGAS